MIDEKGTAVIVTLKLLNKILVGTLETRRFFGRPSCRCEDDIKMSLRAIECDQDSTAVGCDSENMVMNV
jgi:hypothetical protein